MFFSFFSSYLLLRVLKPLLLKKRMTRIVLRMMPMRKVMQMMTSRSTRIKRSVLKSSWEIIKASIGNIVKFIVASEISQTFRSKL